MEDGSTDKKADDVTVEAESASLVKNVEAESVDAVYSAVFTELVGVALVVVVE